ncbi:glycosyltransferase family 4 protein [Pedobacter chitinilyticus]|uniref:Glycosyltransferase n=1 Tax=Pedobacter chitinilyticus TaxID=2233776 RepID=A0A443YXA5_9SPHI|nr:glycosyltransferase family 4 protein [Pedobacter chitinilyticus]RWU08612.1 glycosyltransferase [Pedobacter chitinilyticus]
MKKLVIIVTHPIQYYVPIFRLLAKQCKLKVLYTWGEDGIRPKYDPDFGKTISWDLPLLEGYQYEVLENIAKQPGSHHNKGIINPNIIKKITSFAPDVILIYGYNYHSHFKVMRHFKGKIPIWFRGDSTLLNEQIGFKAIIKKIYLRLIYGFVDKAFYVGTNNKIYFKNYGLKESQLFSAPHAVDIEHFAENRAAEARDLRKKIGIKQDDILILFAGKFEPKKNPELLMTAFLELTLGKSTNLGSLKNSQSLFEVTKKENIHLLFVGNGILEENLKSMHTKNSTSKITEQIVKQIHFMDFQNQKQMPIVYQACDIFCLPSQGPGETWGLAVNEAMAAGKAIIVSNKVGCAVDLVKNGSNGYIFKSNNINDLKEKLSLIINQTDLINSFGKQSREIIENWRFEHQVEQFITNLNATN